MNNCISQAIIDEVERREALRHMITDCCGGTNYFIAMWISPDGTSVPAREEEMSEALDIPRLGPARDVVHCGDCSLTGVNLIEEGRSGMQMIDVFSMPAGE